MTYETISDRKNISRFKILSLFTFYVAFERRFSHHFSFFTLKGSDNVEVNDPPFFRHFICFCFSFSAIIQGHKKHQEETFIVSDSSHISPHSERGKICRLMYFLYAGQDTKHIIKEMTI